MSAEKTTGVVLWQRAEGALVFGAALALFARIDTGLAWWSALALFFAPDLSFAAYGLGRKVGAVVYNSVHLYGLGLVLMAVGSALGLPLLAGLGALWLAHAGFDRMLGYGLKSTEGFGFTHLGPIGRQKH